MDLLAARINTAGIVALIYTKDGVRVAPVPV